MFPFSSGDEVGFRMVEIKIMSGDLDAKLRKLAASLEPEHLLPGMLVELHRIMTLHLSTNYASKANKLGGTSTGYWKAAIDSIVSSIDAAANAVALTFKERGVALHFYGGTVKPVGISEITGKQIQRLALPAIAAAHGHSPKEVPGLEIGKFPGGWGLGKDGQLWFRLVRQTRHNPDPKIIPANLEEQIVQWLQKKVKPAA